MEHLHHSFADHTRQGGFRKSDLTAATEQPMRAPYVLRRLPEAIVSSLSALSDQPHKPRPADPRKPGASFRGQSIRRQRNKPLSRVKLRLRYRLSFLAVNQEYAVKVSERGYCNICMHRTRVGLDPSHPIQLLEIYAVFAVIVLTIHPGLEPEDGTFRTCLPSRTARQR
jgi:hypothetical protein